ncbi:MAG: geranylgeranyl reductase family protein [Thermoleophilia bacterium]|nr:geranylgeranyl reductase family protein [Thermoleophilia bacterium]
MKRFDAVVAGAGPAGSVTAYRLASAGASVLLVDRARFPRDKPCGGGLTMRAVAELPLAPDPVVEHVVTRMRFRHAYGSAYERGGERPLILMTQRRNLDALLAERAAAAGADFRDGVRVTGIDVEADGVTVTLGGERVRAALVVGADGANGLTAKCLAVGPGPTYGVALEGNLPYAEAAKRQPGTAALELGTVPGGYGWVFPKGDHLNFGVGGWAREGPSLRDHLGRLCRAYGVDPDRLRDVRGHRLPLRRPDARLARGRSLLVGDAGGLVDPLSGDGMYEAFVSARLAAAAALDLLSGRAAGLEPYDTAVRRALGRMISASWGAKLAFDRFPRLTFALSRPRAVWPAVEGLLCGELPHPGAATGGARLALRGVETLARLVGSPGPSYRVEGA